MTTIPAPYTALKIEKTRNDLNILFPSNHDMGPVASSSDMLQSSKPRTSSFSNQDTLRNILAIVILYCARASERKRGRMAVFVTATTRKIDAEVSAIVDPVPVLNSAEK